MQTSYEPIFESLKFVEDKFLEVLNSFDEKQINVVPETGSWTAAEVGEHILKATGSLGGALNTPGKKADRKWDEMVPKLEAIFLDFSTKLQSPEFIKPEIKDYKKEELITNLKTAFKQGIEVGQQTELTELFLFPGLGELTKFELLNFVLVHTKRHTNQLEKIAAKVLH